MTLLFLPLFLVFTKIIGAFHFTVQVEHFYIYKNKSVELFKARLKIYWHIISRISQKASSKLSQPAASWSFKPNRKV